MNCWYLTDFSPSQNVAQDYFIEWNPCTNCDSWAADPKNAWLLQHSLFRVPQVLSNKLNPVKKAKNEGIAPWDQGFSPQQHIWHEYQVSLPEGKWSKLFNWPPIKPECGTKPFYSGKPHINHDSWPADPKTCLASSAFPFRGTSGPEQ